MESYKIGLVGPTGPDKLQIVDRMTSLDLKSALLNMKDNSLYSLDYSLIFRFSPSYTTFRISRLLSDEYNSQEMLLKLQEISSEEDGVEKVFKFINREEFVNTTRELVIELPCEEGLIPENNLFDKIDIIENRGFLDGEIFNKQKISKKHEVHLVLFYATDYIKRPESFVETVDLSGVTFKESVFSIGKYEPMESSEEEFNYRVEDYISEEIIEKISKYFSGYIVLN